MIRIIGDLLLLCTCSQVLVAQHPIDSPETLPIDLPTVLKLAGANNIEIQLAEARVDAAHAQSLSANEKYLPTFTPGIFYLQHHDRLQATDGTFLFVNKQSILGGIKGEVSWELRDAIFQSLATHRRANANEQTFEAVTNDILLQAASQYYDLLQGRQSEKLAEESGALFQELEKEIEHKVRIGLGSPSDLYLVRSERAHAEHLLEQRREQSRLASLRLSLTLRLDPGVVLVPADSEVVGVTIIPRETFASSLIEKANTQRPEVRASQYLLDASTREKDAAIWGPLIPTIRASMATGGFGPEFGDLKNSRDLGLTLQWNVGTGGLFDFGRGKFATAQQRTSELQLERTKDQVTNDVLVAHAQMKSKSLQIETAKEELRNAQEAVRLAEERQRTGIGIALEVIQALKSYYVSEKDYLEAIIGYNKAQYALHRAIGERPSAR